MEIPFKKNAIEAVTLLSIVYLVITFILPETQILLWLMALLIVFNYGLSLTYLFQLRGAAFDALEKIDPQWRQSEEAQSAIPHLVEALVNRDSSVRKAAAEALGKIGPTAVKAVPHLVKALVNNESDVRRAAVWALGKAGCRRRCSPYRESTGR